MSVPAFHRHAALETYEVKLRHEVFTTIAAEEYVSANRRTIPARCRRRSVWLAVSHYRRRRG